MVDDFPYATFGISERFFRSIMRGESSLSFSPGYSHRADPKIWVEYVGRRNADRWRQDGGTNRNGALCLASCVKSMVEGPTPATVPRGGHRRSSTYAISHVVIDGPG
jgi:hypothetical protein